MPGDVVHSAASLPGRGLHPHSSDHRARFQEAVATNNLSSPSFYLMPCITQ